MKVTHAMVLAAGLGLRLRPITENLPKPLVEVAGRTMLDHALDHMAGYGVETAAVNCHYLPDMIERHVAGRPSPPISVFREDALLDTGGGVANALSALGSRPFFVANADIIWTDGDRPALARLAEFWREDDMDALLLMHPVASATGYQGDGDFHRDESGRLHRRAKGEASSLVFAGVQILHPRLFENAPDGAFSLNLLFDIAGNNQRLFGLVHDGGWYHVGTPDALAEISALLAG
jgi:N-acetyl-alpha-D-muramate 1-phosphate uridylyltransferase